MSIDEPRPLDFIAGGKIKRKKKPNIPWAPIICAGFVVTFAFFVVYLVGTSPRTDGAVIDKVIEHPDNNTVYILILKCELRAGEYRLAVSENQYNAINIGDHIEFNWNTGKISRIY